MSTTPVGATLPATPGTPTLDPSSDTGTPGDDITKLVRPRIDGTGTAGETVTLYDGLGNNQTVLGIGTVGTDGHWSITSSFLIDGTNIITASEADAAGDMSALSGTLDLTIMSQPPAAPTGLALAPASDTGVQGDDITGLTAPVITGTAAAGSIVTLYDGFANVGSGTVDITGHWSITSMPLAAGTHALSARQTDVAGNVSTGSTVLDLTILTTAAVPTFTESASTTNPAAPVLHGSAGDGATVVISDGAASVGSVTADAAGHWSFAFADALSTGTHSLTAVAGDAAGNTSAASTPLTITVAASGASSVVAALSNGGTAESVYNANGTITAASTVNGAGQVLASVSNGSATLNIYDANGNLIGTISQSGASAASQPQFVTNSGTQSAITASGSGGSTITLLGESNVITSSGNDRLSAGPGADTVFAAGPSVVLTGGAGSLLFVGGTGAATVTGGSGSSTLFGGSGGGVLQGGSAGHNALLAGGGTATLLGGGTGDILVAGSGNDLLVMTTDAVAFGGSGASTVYGAGGGVMVGGNGNTSMVGSAAGGEAMWGGSGGTTEYAGGPNDTLVGGGSGNTTMTGTSAGVVFVAIGGNVTANGGSGNDTFFAAGSGTMTITEGAGNDAVLFAGANITVTGGSGTDVYAFLAQPGTSGANDVISGFKAGTDQLAFYGYSAALPQLSVSGGNTVLTLADGTNVTLLSVTGVSPGSIV
jgi:hypothetical protein